LKKWFLFLGVLVLILGVSDYLAYPILSEVMFKGESSSVIIGREMFMYLIVGLGGAYALNKFPEEMFFQSTDKRKKIARTLGIGLILANTIFYIISFTKYNNEMFTTLLQNNFLGALGVAIRSGITEELLFRFFLINSILFVGTGLSGNTKVIKIGAIFLSAFAFIFIHPLNTAMVTLTAGLVLGYAYFEIGLVSVIVIHALSNLIPFTIIALGLVG